jgi:hypothetical protein
MICIEKFNKSTRLEVKCNYCDYSCCRTCFQKVIIGSILDPHCVNCKKKFTIDFINDTCTKVFINKTLKEHRENVLFEREKILLPATQDFAIREREISKLREELHKEMIIEKKLKEQLIVQKVKIYSSSNKIYHLRNLNNKNQGESSSSNRFFRKCPVVDCRGFLKNESGKCTCGICESTICKKCNEKVLESHECDPDKVKTMELINKDTKPCPSCGCMIYKISGCDQMFCMECHSAFSWNKGTIEKGVIHNPHYYEFLRKNKDNTYVPRNHGDQICGGLPMFYILLDALKYSEFVPEITVEFFSEFHRLVSHINNVEMRAIPNNDNTDLRIKYLNNIITEDEFRVLIQQKEKKIQKKTRINEINQLLVDVGIEIIISIVNFNQINDNINNLLDEKKIIIRNLIDYYNENIRKICKYFKCVYPGINDKLEYCNNYESYLKRNELDN